MGFTHGYFKNTEVRLGGVIITVHFSSQRMTNMYRKRKTVIGVRVNSVTQFSRKATG